MGVGFCPSLRPPLHVTTEQDQTFISPNPLPVFTLAIFNPACSLHPLSWHLPRT